MGEEVNNNEVGNCEMMIEVRQEGWDIEEGWFGKGKLRRWKSTSDVVEVDCVEMWPCNERVKFKRNNSCL